MKDWDSFNSEDELIEWLCGAGLNNRIIDWEMRFSEAISKIKEIPK